MKLLLINPKYPESFWSFKWAVERVLPGKRAVNPPLGLATLAALCPPHWQVTIVDENVESLPLDPQADIVGVCGMGVQFARQGELLGFYRRAGYFTVAGGSFASLCPERYAQIADSVVAGEAERIWRKFCADFEAGMPEPLYRETGTVALADSPVPRFDLLRLDRYTTATMQFSRGCPYLCEFCDIIVMFGRKPRHKSVEQVGRELDALRAAGARNVFFVDDNMIGHRAVAGNLLRFLADYQKRHDRPFTFGTEVSLNLAQDRELLELFREAGFTWVFVGIESSDPQTLKDTRKTQNVHEDVLTSVRRIYAHGIDVLAGFIVGFDNDTAETFDSQYRFIVESGVQAAMVGLLTALPKTPLYRRLEKEGRLRPAVAGTDNTKPATNVQPKRMSYEQLISAYEAMYRRLVSDAAIAARVRNKFRFMAQPVYGGEYTTSQQIGIVWLLLMRGVLRGGPLRLWHFLRSLPLAHPRKLPLVMVDWIAGLSMRDFVDRHFSTRPVDPGRVTRLAAAIRRAGRPYLDKAAMTLSLRTVPVPDFSIRLRAGLSHAFFVTVARHLDRLLRKTRSTLTLRIESLRERELPDLDRLLARLARHGDRVFIVLDERLRNLVRIDSSVFHLVLEGSVA
ncbi:MAG TPA: radical SAM protein [Burkholderiales bacterium]|nr:radical SAM protein [Burkholderiales bacterium]